MPGWTHTGFAQKIVFGEGSLDQLPGLLKELGLRRVMLVTTNGRLASDDGQRVAAKLARSRAATFADVRSHVPTTAVQTAVRQALSDGVDSVVSFGGGSCADLGKAVCFFVEQQAGTPGASFSDRPALPHISIPTTYSGAELTPFFGMTDEAARRKTGSGGPTIAPRAAIYDPVLTLDTPVRVSAETGMNCLAHGVEAVWSAAHSPEAEAIALACISRVVSALPNVVDEPGDPDARAAMLEAAVLGGRCLQNAAMGVHHGLSQLVGGRTGIAHGLANAVLLAHAIRFNAGDPALYEPLAKIGVALGDPDDPAGAVDRLRERIGLPGQLSDAGMTDEDIDAVVRMVQTSPAIKGNPRAVSEDDARGILEAAF